jgi:hypothetical protein
MILALTAGLVASQSMVTDIWQQLTTDSIRVVQAWSSSALGAISIGPARPRLIVQQSCAANGEPAPLGLTLHGPIDGALVHIEGLVRRMELSAGRAIGFDTWEVPADDLGDAWIIPPDGFAGSVNFVAVLRGPDGKVADRQTITLEWPQPTAPVPDLGLLTESMILASISPIALQLRYDQNYRTDAPLLESHITPRERSTDPNEAAAQRADHAIRANQHPLAGGGGNWADDVTDACRADLSCAKAATVGTARGALAPTHDAPAIARLPLGRSDSTRERRTAGLRQDAAAAGLSESIPLPREKPRKAASRQNAPREAVLSGHEDSGKTGRADGSPTTRPSRASSRDNSRSLRGFWAWSQ